MDKKAVGRVDSVVAYIWKLFFTVIVFTILLIFINGAVKYDIDTFPTEANILSFRLLYAKGALSYYDAELHRNYPGIIDLSRFRQGMLDSVIDYKADSDHITAKIELEDIQGNEYDPIYLNKEAYMKWYPVAKTKGKGPGAAQFMEKSFYVLVKDIHEKEELLRDEFSTSYKGSQEFPAKLHMTIVKPNS